jgi:hypothetical protein
VEGRVGRKGGRKGGGSGRERRVGRSQSWKGTDIFSI